jgi:hypothetical protein
VLTSPRLKGSLWFAHEGIVETTPTTTSLAKIEAKSKPTIDPRLTKLARELRDVWTERQAPKILPAPAKHDVRRMIGEQSDLSANAIKNLALPKAA